jgi:hypothetical protein
VRGSRDPALLLSCRAGLSCVGQGFSRQAFEINLSRSRRGSRNENCGGLLRRFCSAVATSREDHLCVLRCRSNVCCDVSAQGERCSSCLPRPRRNRPSLARVVRLRRADRPSRPPTIHPPSERGVGVCTGPVSEKQKKNRLQWHSRRSLGNRRHRHRRATWLYVGCANALVVSE